MLFIESTQYSHPHAYDTYTTFLYHIAIVLGIKYVDYERYLFVT